MMPYSRATLPAVSSSPPPASTGSRCRLCAGTCQAIRAAAASAIGTPAQNSACQPPNSTARPPPRLPITPPIPVNPDHSATPRGGGARAPRGPRAPPVVGSTSAAPTPVSARPAISTTTLGASAARVDPAANKVRPVSIPRLRPNRSPSAPAGISRHANTSV